MQNVSSAFNTAISASVRKVKAKAEFYNDSALANTFTEADKIISFDIQRVGENGKFFGFGICHRLNIHLIDVARALNITTDNTVKMSIGVGTDYVGFPTFKVSEVHRDEKTNELSITAYDTLYQASKHTVSELTLTKPYTMKQFVEAIGAVLGVTTSGHDNFTLNYENGANFDGTETLRNALDDVSEATQTIYYLDATNTLCFKQLDRDGSAVANIDKAKYITLKSGTGHRLQTICMATELGDNVHESTTLVGSTQYVRDNAFWELRTDIATLIHDAITAIGNISIDVFDCTWRGNPALEIGDKLTLITKDNKTITSYLLNDTIKYDGSLQEQTQWKYDTNNVETESNPTSLNDVLNKTYAKVDKQQQQITLLASEINDTNSNISQIQMDTDNINASVTNIQNNIDNINDSLSERIDSVEQKAELSVTPEQVQIAISNEMAKGTDKVVTSTGFTFDESGLTVSKSDSEISTNIDEDGMSIYKNNEEVLTADNTGVTQINATIKQYLIVGLNSRFEDYGSDRTGCFWIGS